jgi:hypothetical protein
VVEACPADGFGVKRGIGIEVAADNCHAKSLLANGLTRPDVKFSSSKCWKETQTWYAVRQVKAGAHMLDISSCHRGGTSVYLRCRVLL